jgi:hypothetical protein
VIGGNAIHVPRLVGNAAKEIAAANDNRHLDSEIVYIGKFGRDFVNARGVDAEALIGR